MQEGNTVKPKCQSQQNKVFSFQFILGFVFKYESNSCLCSLHASF